MTTIIDSNVIIDVAVDDPQHAPWSRQELENAALRGRLLANQIVYTEVARAFRSKKAMARTFEATGIERENLPFDCAHLAAEAYARFIKNKGRRKGLVLPDFLIGAHAMHAGHDLLTRDPKRFRTYFPGVTLYTP